MGVYQFVDKNLGIEYRFKDDEKFKEGLLKDPKIKVYGFSQMLGKERILDKVVNKAELEFNEATKEVARSKKSLKYHKFWNYRKFWKEQTQENSSITKTGLGLGFLYGGIFALSKYILGDDVGDALFSGFEIFLGFNALIQMREEYIRNVNKKRINKKLIYLRKEKTYKERIYINSKNSKLEFVLDEDAKKVGGKYKLFDESIVSNLFVDRYLTNLDFDEQNKLLEKAYLKWM